LLGVIVLWINRTSRDVEDSSRDSKTTSEPDQTSENNLSNSPRTGNKAVLGNQGPSPIEQDMINAHVAGDWNKMNEIVKKALASREISERSASMLATRLWAEAARIGENPPPIVVEINQRLKLGNASAVDLRLLASWYQVDQQQNIEYEVRQNLDEMMPSYENSDRLAEIAFGDDLLLEAADWYKRSAEFVEDDVRPVITLRRLKVLAELSDLGQTFTAEANELQQVVSSMGEPYEPASLFLLQLGLIARDAEQYDSAIKTLDFALGRSDVPIYRRERISLEKIRTQFLWRGQLSTEEESTLYFLALTTAVSGIRDDANNLLLKITKR